MFPNCATSEDLLKAIKDEKVQMIDLRFTDLPGVWQHFSVPPSAVNADALEEGIGFAVRPFSTHERAPRRRTDTMNEFTAAIC